MVNNNAEFWQFKPLATNRYLSPEKANNFPPRPCNPAGEMTASIQNYFPGIQPVVMHGNYLQRLPVLIAGACRFRDGLDQQALS